MTENVSKPLLGKQCVVTGGTSGIGLMTARRLAQQGASVLLVGRDRQRGELALDYVHQGGAGEAVYLQADLSDQDAVRSLAHAIAQRCRQVDVLVNNAGGMFGRRQPSAQGLEMTFALNHLNYFLLTALLLPQLRAAQGGARIVVVSSEAHRRVNLDFDDLQADKSYSGWLAYRRSKLANLLFTLELARRLDPRSITVNALHPGFVATDIGVRFGLVPPWIWKLAKLAAISPEKGAHTPVFLASAAEVAATSGRYFHQCKPKTPSRAAMDGHAARRLWDESVRLTGVDPL